VIGQKKEIAQPRWNRNDFCNILEMTYQPSSAIVLVSQTDLGTMWEGNTQEHECQKVGTIEYHFEDPTQLKISPPFLFSLFKFTDQEPG
jgi:hypothetical protein